MRRSHYDHSASANSDVDVVVVGAWLPHAGHCGKPGVWSAGGVGGLAAAIAAASRRATARFTTASAAKSGKSAMSRVLESSAACVLPCWGRGVGATPREAARPWTVSPPGALPSGVPGILAATEGYVLRRGMFCL